MISSDLTVISEAKVDFDADFGAKYGISKGVHINEAEGEVYAPVEMWLEALNLVLERLKETTPLENIKGISGSCQQHGSVYWSREAEAALSSLDAEKTLLEQLKTAFSRPWAPNWQDHSTQDECDQFDAKFGAPERLAEVTGSSAHHVRAPGRCVVAVVANRIQRFTGTQIMRIRRKWPDVYANTSRISLVSSFLASLLLGSVAPMDISDVCGMNLWDIPNNQWSEPLLELAAGGKEAGADLRSKLGEVRRDGGGSMGAVSAYYVRRYGFSADCQVAPFTGDNPATILALPLRPLDAIVSLGTSTTFLMITPHYEPDPAYHFFNHPTMPGQYMFMLCYKNGGLAREKVRDALPQPDAAAGSDPWAAFNAAVRDTPALGAEGPDGRAKLGLYFYLNEIVPNIRAGTWRYTSAADGSDLAAEGGDGAGWDARADARAIVESQALSMRLRSRNLVDAPAAGLPAQPRRVYLVGGGSVNAAIADVVGDVLGGAEGVYRLDVGGNACALGGAYKALWALERRDAAETFDELIGRRWREEGAIQKVGGGFRDGVFQRYGAVLGAFEEMERTILGEQGR